MTDKEFKTLLEHDRIKNLSDLLQIKPIQIKDKEPVKKVLTEEDFGKLLTF